ncbi:hypothetical protein PhCBS80983_g05501 [Powellomyces hirtus]|uniref:Organic hydroperoxide resistance protein n=1 Tax=Powellomyces hirtus TaxID=109895 RepID=A0A507DU00_9FUNG|nr:organic hydroperoxide resistance protein [Powellomyces hirtus]TPX55234.1 hypothetical protein PhCBS80983_g05501 [Powellomyces hirtus]
MFATSRFVQRAPASRMLKMIAPVGTRAASSAAKSLYQTTSIASGKGRSGNVSNQDSQFKASLALPKSMGGPGNADGTVNPEILFASGYASCFLGAVQAVAGAKKVSLPAETSVKTVVDLKKDTNFELAVKLTLSVPGLSQKVADDVVTTAHEMCPYSRATRGNIEVDVKAVV